MQESVISSFLMWSMVTGIVMIVTGLSYRVYMKKKNQGISSV